MSYLCIVKIKKECLTPKNSLNMKNVIKLPKNTLPTEGKVSLDLFVRTLAKSTKLNLNEAHRAIKATCKEIVAFADANDVPMSVVAYIGVSTEAHKKENFLNACVSKWNAERASAITEMAKHFAQHFGYAKPNTDEYHAMFAVYKMASAEAAKTAIDGMAADSYNRTMGMNAKTIAELVNAAVTANITAVATAD